MTEPIKLTLDAPLEIEGRGGAEQDTVVLEVRGGSTQTEPLQRWETSVGDVLAELTSGGELRLGGDLIGDSPAALVEADAQIDITSDKPKRGWQSRGEIVGAITDVIRWAVHELVLLGEETLTGLHSALRAQVTVGDNSDPTLDAQDVEVHAAEFEAVNATGSESEPVGRLVAVQATITNEADAYLSEAVAFEVTEPVNGGSVNRLVGLQIADLGVSEAGAERYALWTGQGRVHLGDVLELVEPDPIDPETAQSVQVYVKDDGGLYARDSDEVEYNLLMDEGGAESLDELSDVVITAPAEGDILRRNATEFVNAPLSDYVFLESEHLASSSGSADAGKPIKLDAGGQVDASMINDADIDHGSLGGLADDDHAQYHTDGRALTWLSSRSTGDVPEGANLYFTNERAQDAVGAALTDSASIDFTYDDAGNTISAAVLPAGVDHGSLAGLTDDDHPNYVWLSPSADTRNVIQPTASTIKGLVIKGAASQADALLELQNSSGAVLSYISPTQVVAPLGSLSAPGLSFIGQESWGFSATGFNFHLSTHGIGRMSFDVSGARVHFPGAWAIAWTNGNSSHVAETWISRAAVNVLQLGSASGYSSLIVGTSAVGTIPLRVRGIASQTANLQQWLDSSSNVLALIDKDGGVVFNEQGSDADCRIEGDTDANLFVTDASADRVGIGTNNPTTKLDINADTLRLRTAKTPASASDTGNAGEICWDADYLYICTATNTWKRTALATW